MHRSGQTEQVAGIEPAWLDPSSSVFIWADLAAPSTPEALILSDTFGFHPLSVEDAMSPIEYPKIESHEGYLYVVLHFLGFKEGDAAFASHDIDFFLGRNFLVTVHNGQSPSVQEAREHCPRRPAILGEGPVALFHRIVDRMVDRYLPKVEQLEEQLDLLEEAVLEEAGPPEEVLRRVLAHKRDISALRRIATPQRDVVNRLSRREFANISTEMAVHFRDVYDHLSRVNDEALMLSDRLTGILDAHFSNVSNRLNRVMKILTVLTTVFMPLTVLASLYGMNVVLPQLPGGEDLQFWWLVGFMAAIALGMLGVFRRLRWL